MKRWYPGLQLLGVGWYVSISIILGVLAGRWFDNKLDSEPLLLIIGLILGITLSVYGVYRMIPMIVKSDTKEN
ncbi:MAG: AtpZ/AtpI family protein [Chloroflexi bacterium]|nr:AtpZ/AtpI family protein [Chloroflexota bacterium]